MSEKPARAIEVFFSYSHEDEELRNELGKHLSILKRQGVIQSWHDRRIGAGKEWRGEIDTHLNRAHVILLLISADFLASDYCYDVEMKRAMERHEAGEAFVIPVILRPVDWKGAPFGKLQALPTDAVPVTEWPNRDKAFLDVAQGIRAAVKELMRGTVAEEVKAPPPVRKPRWLPTALGIASVVLLAAACIAAGVVVFGLLQEETPPVSVIALPTVSPTTPLPTNTVTSSPTAPPTPTPTMPPTPTPTMPPTPTPTMPPTPTPTTPPTPTPPPPPGMVYVLAGEFIMGSDKGQSDEQPVRTVYLDAFYIDRYEVTNAQYRACVEAGACSQPHNTEWYNDPARAKHPVVHVDWNQANAYCQWIGKRLPTEAEWEKAARGTDGWTWPWGNSFDSEKVNSWESGGSTTQVDGYANGASTFGALNMAGNAAEWTADWYSSDYYHNAPIRNPQGPVSGRLKVARGGSWRWNQEGVRTADRNAFSPDTNSHDVGFRCAKSSE